MAISLPLGSGNSGTNDWADVYNNDAQLVTEIDDRDGNYQTIFSVGGNSNVDTAAGTYIVQGPVITALTSVASNGAQSFYFDDADYAISSKTQKLRLRAQVQTNATAWSSVTATFGLYPVSSVAGGADALAFTLGTVISGSTVAFANPAASSLLQSNSGDFTIPADGQYLVGVVLSATLTNNATANFNAQVQTHWV